MLNIYCLADASRNMNLKKNHDVGCIDLHFLLVICNANEIMNKTHLIFIYFGILHCIYFTMIICRPLWNNNINSTFRCTDLYLHMKNAMSSHDFNKMKKIYQLIKGKNDY